MSSTQRGAERLADDTYFTRYPCALAICKRLLRDGVIRASGTSPETVRILEPSCGRGAFVRAAADAGFYPSTVIHALDLNTKLLLPEHAQYANRVISSDFTDYRPKIQYDAVIGNPPYSQAEAHVEHALSLVREGGVVAFLLRLNFLAGIERHGWSIANKRYEPGAFYDRCVPDLIYPLDKRPPFLEGNKTDSCEYAVFVWEQRQDAGLETSVRPLRWRQYLEEWEMAVEKRPKKKPAAKKASKKPRKKK